MANANAIVKVASTEIAIPAEAKNELAKLGVEEQDTPRVVALAIVCGMDPALLANQKNVRALHQAWTMVANYGMMPGTHLYMVPFGKEAKTEYSVIPSVNYLQGNVEQHGRLTGISYILQTKPILDADLVTMYLDNFGPPNYVKSPNNRVVLARFIPVVGGVPQMKPTEGWEMASVGYYLHDGVNKSGREGNYTIAADKNAGPIAQANPGRTAMGVAKTRAIRQAAREVTRTFYPVDNTPVQGRLEGVIRNAVEIVEGKRSALKAPTEENVLDASATDSEIADGDFVELANSIPGAEVVTPGSKPKASGAQEWVRLVWESLTPEMRAWTSEANPADNKGTVKSTTYRQMQEWVAATASIDTGATTSDADDVDFLVVDLILAVMSGQPIGDAPTVGFAKAFYESIGVKTAKTWELGDGNNIASQIIKAAAAQFVGDGF